MRTLPALVLLTLLSPAALPCAPAPEPVAPAQQAELPLVFKGDGMTVRITAIDGTTGEASGTVQIDAGPAMPLTLNIKVNAHGEEVGIG
ncbi:MAG: hypothetical protein GY773_22185, partial [Actinomycetia bacterium]|nr:hypothetical protein [Actinomycetes bacterium]